jgi:hypothetical protein
MLPTPSLFGKPRFHGQPLTNQFQFEETLQGGQIQTPCWTEETELPVAKAASSPRQEKGRTVAKKK